MAVVRRKTSRCAKAAKGAMKASKVDVLSLVVAEQAKDSKLSQTEAIKLVVAASHLAFAAAKTRFFQQKLLQLALAPAPAPPGPGAGAAVQPATTTERAKAMQQFVLDGMTPETALEKACARSDANPKAVQHQYYRYRSDAVKAVHGNATITLQQNHDLVAAVLSLAMLNFPPSVKDVEELAKVLPTPVEFVSSVGNRWGRRWLKKQQKAGILSALRVGKSVSHGRASHEAMLKSCRSFAAQMTREIAKYGHPPPTAVINGDETIVQVAGGGLSVKRVTWRSAGRVNVAVGAGGNTIGSMLAFVNAAGACLLRVVVLKKKAKDGLVDLRDIVLPKKDLVGSPRGKVRTLFLYSDTGLIDEAMYFQIVKAFCDEWALRGISADVADKAPLRAWVYLDQLAVHRTREVIAYGLKKGVALWSLPRNTSHLTQPLDDIVFAVFKKELRSLFEGKKMKRMKGELVVCYKELLLQSLWEAFDKAFKPATIKLAFKNVHLYPFEEKEFLAHCEASIGTTIVDDEHADVTCVASAVVKMLTSEKKVAEKEEEKYKKVGSARPGLRVFCQDIHSPDDLLQLTKQYDELVASDTKQKADAKAARATVAAVRKRTCEEAAEAAKCWQVEKPSGEACKKKFRGGKGWFICGICKTYKLCQMHDTPQKRRQHAHTCDALPTRVAKRLRVAAKK